MERKKIYRKTTMVVFILVSFIINFKIASADAWWGKGFRSKEWVLDHGGTIVKFQMDNISGDSSEYRAVMYKKNGDYVEKESGAKGYFDDAKDKKYKIVAYRGASTDKIAYKGGEEFAEINVTAHPRETIKINFNYETKDTKMTSEGKKKEPKDDSNDEKKSKKNKKKKSKTTAGQIKLVPRLVLKPVTVPLPKQMLSESMSAEGTQSESGTVEFPSIQPEQMEQMPTIVNEQNKSVVGQAGELIHPDNVDIDDQQSNKKGTKNILQKIMEYRNKFFSFR